MPLVSPVQEVDQILNFTAFPESVTKNFKCFNSRVFFPVKASVCLLQAFYGFRRVALAFQAHLVDGPDLHGAALYKHIGRDV